jgi:two-component system, NtrC family, response regulator HydG
VDAVSRGIQALERIEKSRFDILLLDLQMPGVEGLEVLRRARTLDDSISVIIMTGYATLESAVTALKLGAEDFLLKPLELEVLRLALSKALGHRQLRMEHALLQQRMASLGHSHGIIARSKSMEDVLTLAAKVASLRSTVLIEGESGTGKELLARAIHAGNPRADRPFVAINCGVIPLTLLESELFGHERGAFTGAETRRVGYFEAAAGGTIFLDEISETSLELQVKLLRVLQERTFRRVGGAQEITTDARVIVSTNRNLEDEVKAGRLRHDLYYRLNVIILRVPPLRQRPEDISVLAHHFLEKYSSEFSKKAAGISSRAMDRLLRHSWPGNVRELENTIERAVALSDGGEIDLVDILPLASTPAALPENPPAPRAVQAYADARRLFEQEYLNELLKASGGNITEASRLAGIARQNLYVKMKKLGLTKDISES